MTRHRIYSTSVASVYPHYVAKAERKGRAKAEESRAIVTLIEQAWRETDGGQVSPPRPW